LTEMPLILNQLNRVQFPVGAPDLRRYYGYEFRCVYWYRHNYFRVRY